MTNAATLSVCMIVKNEELTLGRCLESIVDVADELIIVDTGSTDTTVSIARQYSAIIIEEQWRNDFAFARNRSIEQAASSWILWLDADDIVPRSSLSKITRLKGTLPDRVYGFIVRNQRPGNTGTEFVQARMFPNDKRIRFERRIHEQMMPCALRLGMTLQKTDVVVEHHGYAEPSVLKIKAKRNLDLLLEEYRTHDADTVTTLEIADSYQLIDDLENACVWYKKVVAIAHARQQTPALVGQALFGLGAIANRQEQFSNAIGYLSDALTLSPWRPDIHYSLSVAFELSGDTQKARDHLRQLLSLDEQPGQVGVDFRGSKIKAYLRLIRLHIESNDFAECFTIVAQALEMFPTRPELYTMSGKALLKAGKLVDSLRAFEKSIQLFRDGNLDSYIGLCIIYRAAGVEQKVVETLTAIAPLFGQIEKYCAFRMLFSKSEAEISDVTDSHRIMYEQIRKEFFFVI